MTLTLLHSKMFDVGDLPVLTSGNCVLKTGVIKWPLKLFVRFFYVFNVFFQNPKNMTFYVFWVIAHVFSNAGLNMFIKYAMNNITKHIEWICQQNCKILSIILTALSSLNPFWVIFTNKTTTSATICISLNYTYLIFTARCYACAVLAMGLCLSVSVCLSVTSSFCTVAWQ